MAREGLIGSTDQYYGWSSQGKTKATIIVNPSDARFRTAFLTSYQIEESGKYLTEAQKKETNEFMEKVQSGKASQKEMEDWVDEIANRKTVEEQF